LIGNQVHTMSSGPSEKGPGHWYNVLLQECLFSHLPYFLNTAPVRIYSSGHKKKLLVFIFVRKLPNLVGAIFKKTMEDKRNSLLLVASV
jgi:hypothetical protein